MTAALFTVSILLIVTQCSGLIDIYHANFNVRYFESGSNSIDSGFQQFLLQSISISAPMVVQMVVDTHKKKICLNFRNFHLGCRLCIQARPCCSLYIYVVRCHFKAARRHLIAFNCRDPARNPHSKSRKKRL